MDPHFKYDLIFMNFGIQSRRNTLILNTLLGIDDLVPNFGPALKLLELIFIAWTQGNFILKLKYALFLFIRLRIEIVVKSRRTV